MNIGRVVGTVVCTVKTPTLSGIKLMVVRQIVNGKFPFVRREVSADEARALFADQLRQISIELARIDSDEITDAESSALFDLLDQLYLRASRIARRTND